MAMGHTPGIIMFDKPDAEPWYGWMSLGRSRAAFQQAAHEPVEVVDADNYGSIRCKCATADDKWREVVSDCPFDIALDQAATYGYNKGFDMGYDSLSEQG